MLIAQTVTLYDKKTEKEIELAYLISFKPNKSLVTNKKGEVDISPLKNSELIHIQAPGYVQIETNFEQIQKDNYKVYLERMNFDLDEIVVSATRWRQNAGNLPQEVVRINQKDNLFQNPQTAADLLASSGKVFVQKSQQGGGSPMMRGFATNRLLYSVDGVRMNTAIFRSGNVQNIINLDPFAMENMEVLFGPGSVIYGSDAIGGVMTINTLTPQLSAEKKKPLIKGKALGRFSTANFEKAGHFDINVGWKKFAFVTSFSVWDFDDLIQGKNGPEDYIKPFYVQRVDTQDVVIYQENELMQKPSAYAQINFMQKVRYQPNENWNLEYGFHYSETTDYGRYDRHNRLENGIPKYAEWYYGPQKWMMNNFGITHSGSNVVYDEMTLRIAQQTFGESRHSRNFNNVLKDNRLERVDAYSANWDFNKGLGEKNTLYYGFEYVLNTVKSSGTVEDITSDYVVNGPARYPNSLWHSASVYITDEYRINKKVTFSAGLRYGYFLLDTDFKNNEDFYPLPFSNARNQGGALTGSLGCVIRPNKKWAIRTVIGTAYRAPNVDDMGKIFDSEPGIVVVPNTDLKAEYAYNADISISKIFGNFAKIEVEGFYTFLDNAMVRRDYQLNGQDSILYDGELSRVQAVQNASFAHVFGFMFSAEFKLPLGFELSTDFNYQEGLEKNLDGTLTAARHAAPIFGVGRVSYTFKDLKLEVNITYQGNRKHEDLALSEQGKKEIYALDENGNTYAPSWYTLNFKAMYTLWEKLNITVGVENITNQRYRPYSSGISGAGRNFVFGVSFVF